MNSGSHPDPGAYDFDLWVKLETTIDMYEQDRADYWAKRLDAEEWSPLKQLRNDADEIARLIRKRALSLQGRGEPSELNGIHTSIQDAKARLIERLKGRAPDSAADSLLQAILRQGLFGVFDSESAEVARGSNISDAPIKLIWERLWIDDAWELVIDIRERANRIWDLERLVDKVFDKGRPPEPCARFLALVSRCYVFGFAPECVAMCRAAMEQAFRDRVTEEQCAVAGQRDDLAGRINTAFGHQSGILTWDEELFRAADAVKERGNKVLHYDPDATKDVAGTIEAALRVIAALSA